MSDPVEKAIKAYIKEQVKARAVNNSLAYNSRGDWWQLQEQAKDVLRVAIPIFIKHGLVLKDKHLRGVDRD